MSSAHSSPLHSQYSALVYRQSLRLPFDCPISSVDKVKEGTVKMALHQFLCSSTLMMILLSGGCHSQTPVCGQAPMNTRIIGGQNASPGSWPWMVSLNSEDQPFCAGSLINNQWVLTAAHCLTGSDLLTTTVYLGRQSQSGLNFEEVSSTLERIICHPLHNSLTNENDICLLKLSLPVQFTDFIQPVCLASAGSTFHSGVSSWVTGFGDTQAGSSSRSDILQEVNVPTIGNNECKCTYSFIKDSMICAGFKEGGKDACQGDSGSALVTKKGFMWIQSGVVSFGEGCGRPMTPGVYTRVSDYQEWITNITASNKPGFVTYTSSGVDSDLNFICSTSTTTPTTTPMTTTTPTTTTMTTTTPTTTTMTTTTPKTTAMTTTTPTTTTTTTMTTTTPTSNTATTTTPTTTTETPTTAMTCASEAHNKMDSVFDSGVNVIQSSHFTSLCLLVISLYVLVGET